MKGLQRIGRGLRKSKGKSIVEVIDFMDETTPHLNRHSNIRWKLWKKEGFKVYET